VWVRDQWKWAAKRLCDSRSETLMIGEANVEHIDYRLQFVPYEFFLFGIKIRGS